MSDETDTSFSLSPPRGTHDLLPGQTETWQKLERAAMEVFKLSGYREIRTPVFEHTEVFKRGVGVGTDIVNKEMYTFLDKSQRSLTLRPEATAGIVRAYLHGGLARQASPVKLWYIGPMFRYERPQVGRYRQFHQVDAEAFGSEGPLIDAELILLAWQFLTRAEIKDLEIQINSIGCRVCRGGYRKVLQEKYRPVADQLCSDCQERLEKNPLRMLDCKHEHCKQLYLDAPAPLDHLCQDCKDHWKGLTQILASQDVKVAVNPRLVRGLDYYCRTVFEIVSYDRRLGVQGTVCGGGRYDYLVETFGGAPTPGVGWAAGLERLVLLSEQELPQGINAFVVSNSPEYALTLASKLRQVNVSCELDFAGKGLDPRNFARQLQQANKLAARFAVIAFDDEIKANTLTVKDMVSGIQETIAAAGLIEYMVSKMHNT